MYASKYIRVELYLGHPQSRIRLISDDKQTLDKVLAILRTDQIHIFAIEPSIWNWLITLHRDRVYKYVVKLNDRANSFAFAQSLIQRLSSHLTYAIEFATYSQQ